MLHQTPQNGGTHARDDLGSDVLVPSWSLRNDSRISVHTNTVEFAYHAFPLDVFTDMEAMYSLALAHNMSYVSAQAMLYMVAGSHRIRLLKKMEVAHAGCGARKVELRHQIVELEKDVHESDQRYALLVSEKVVSEDIQSGLETKVDSLTQPNEGMIIQNES